MDPNAVIATIEAGRRQLSDATAELRRLVAAELAKPEHARDVATAVAVIANMADALREQSAVIRPLVAAFRPVLDRRGRRAVDAALRRFEGQRDRCLKILDRARDELTGQAVPEGVTLH